MARNNMYSRVCQFCGERIKSDAKACPHCGSDENTGWSEQTYLDGIDLNDDFDYDELLQKEFPGKKTIRKSWWFSWQAITGAVLLALFTIIYLSAVW